MPRKTRNMARLACVLALQAASATVPGADDACDGPNATCQEMSSSASYLQQRKQSTKLAARRDQLEGELSTEKQDKKISTEKQSTDKQNWFCKDWSALAYDNKWTGQQWDVGGKIGPRQGVFVMSLYKSSPTDPKQLGAYGTPGELKVKVKKTAGGEEEVTGANGGTPYQLTGSNVFVQEFVTDYEINSVEFQTPTWGNSWVAAKGRVCQFEAEECFEGDKSVDDNSWPELTWEEAQAGEGFHTVFLSKRNDGQKLGAWCDTSSGAPRYKMEMKTSVGWEPVPGNEGATGPCEALPNLWQEIETGKEITGIRVNTPTWGQQGVSAFMRVCRQKPKTYSCAFSAPWEEPSARTLSEIKGFHTCGANMMLKEGSDDISCGLSPCTDDQCCEPDPCPNPKYVQLGMKRTREDLNGDSSIATAADLVRMCRTKGKTGGQNKRGTYKMGTNCPNALGMSGSSKGWKTCALRDGSVMGKDRGAMSTNKKPIVADADETAHGLSYQYDCAISCSR